MKEQWAELLARPHVVEALGPGVELEDRHTAWPIPAGIDRATLSSGRVLFVGDAAMATDTMTGEGIGQAVLTGRLAAEAIIATGALQPDVVARPVRDRRPPPPGGRPPHVGAAQPGPRPRARRPRRDAPGRRSTAGRAATSPAGCSRTSPERSPSPPRAGTAQLASRRNPAPTDPDHPSRPVFRRPPECHGSPSVERPPGWSFDTRVERSRGGPAASSVEVDEFVAQAVEIERDRSRVTRSTCQPMR